MFQEKETYLCQTFLIKTHVLLLLLVLKVVLKAVLKVVLKAVLKVVLKEVLKVAGFQQQVLAGVAKVDRVHKGGPRGVHKEALKVSQLEIGSNNQILYNLEVGLVVVVVVVEVVVALEVW